MGRVFPWTTERAYRVRAIVRILLIPFLAYVVFMFLSPGGSSGFGITVVAVVSLSVGLGLSFFILPPRRRPKI